MTVIRKLPFLHPVDRVAPRRYEWRGAYRQPGGPKEKATAKAAIAPYGRKFIVPAKEQYCGLVKAVNKLVHQIAPYLLDARNPDPADPWLIAVAKVHGYTFVTDEKADSSVKIPAACDNASIKCPWISGPHFLVETGIVTEIKPEHISVHPFYGIGRRS